MRRSNWLIKSSPYKCDSLINGIIEVRCSWPQYGDVWQAEKGGGPGFSGRMALAADIETFLNSPYSPEQIEEGHRRIAEHEENWEKAVEQGRKKS